MVHVFHCRYWGGVIDVEFEELTVMMLRCVITIAVLATITVLIVKKTLSVLDQKTCSDVQQNDRETQTEGRKESVSQGCQTGGQDSDGKQYKNIDVQTEETGNVEYANRDSESQKNQVQIPKRECESKSSQTENSIKDNNSGDRGIQPTSNSTNTSVEIRVNIIEPPAIMKNIHEEILRRLSQGLQLRHDPAGPCLVTVVNNSRLLADINRDLRRAKGENKNSDAFTNVFIPR